MERSVDDLHDLVRRNDAARRRYLAGQPKRAADIMAAVLHRRGYARIMENEQLTQRWSAVVDARLKAFTRPLRIYRRRLEVLVANSTVMQELTFSKARLVTAFNDKSGDRLITDIRFRIGEVGAE